MKCREKELPHYFGRLIHALDLIKFSQNEGTLKNLQQQQVYTTYLEYEIGKLLMNSVPNLEFRKSTFVQVLQTTYSYTKKV